MHNQAFSIREAVASDAGLILDMIKELAAYEELSDHVEANEEVLLDSIFTRQKAQALIMESNGKAIGYAIYFYNFSTFTGKPGLYIEDIYIRPEYRGNGFGKAIFSHFASIAIRERCARIEWACLHWNEPSIRFYKGMGAQAMSDWGIYRLTSDSIEHLSKQ